MYTHLSFVHDFRVLHMNHVRILDVKMLMRIGESFVTCVHDMIPWAVLKQYNHMATP
jgi:hypothetical protein